MHEGKIHIGTSGWSYEHWRERFYPKGLQPAEWLPYYAKFFETAEINTSFYHLPLATTVQHWAGEVKSGFYFCPKLSRFITHIKKLHDPENTLPKFFEVFAYMQKKAGPVLVQLPPNLAFNAATAEHFYTVLHKQYGGYHFAIEGRHESWLAKESIALLEKYKISFVIAEFGGMRPYGEFITARHVYLRFHGRAGYAYSYTDDELKLYADKCLQWKHMGHTVWVFFNNDGEGYAVANAQKLEQLLGQ